MVKKLLLAALGLALVAGACHSSESNGAHWRRSSGTQTLVVLQLDPSAESLRPWVENAAWDWSHVPNVEVVVRPCQPGENCVPVYGEVRNGGLTSIGAGADGHIVPGSGTWIRLDNSPGQLPANLDNLACHEVGHALGLNHSSDGTQGPCQGGSPTVHDQNLVMSNHNHVDSSGPPGV